MHRAVAASDGVFEFITNKELGGMVKNTGDSVMQTCDDIVETAYQRWLDADSRTDDITIICAKIAAV